MGCGCSQTRQSPSGVPLNESGSGSEYRKDANDKASLIGRAGTAPPRFLPHIAKDAGERGETDHAAKIAAATRINKERHARSISLVQLERTRAAMCFICPAVSDDGRRCLLSANHNAEIDGIDLGPIQTREAFVSSNLVAEIAKNGYSCPLGRHPQGEDQVTRWMGLSWYGVPEPLRWLIAVRRWKNDTLDKCGCCVPLKSLSKRWGFGWLSVLEKLPELRKDMAMKKVFKGGPARFKGRAWRYLKWRAKRTLQG